MTQPLRSAEQNDMESALPELPRLRELSRLNRPSTQVSRAVFARVQHTMNADTQGTPNSLRLRTWALALGLTVAVPTAFAATPVGSALVERTVKWATSVLQVEDSTSAERETATVGVPRAVTPAGNAGAQLKPAIQAAPPVAAFENAKDPAAARDPVASSAAGNPPAAQAAVRPTPSLKARNAAAGLAPALPTNGAQAASVGSLNAERLLLEDARAHLRAGDAHSALALTSRHAEQFPAGILSAERQAIIKQVRQLEGRTP